MILRLSNITGSAIDPALAMLPMLMDTPTARIQLLAIGLQESRFEYRRQLGGGPAKSFWQMERGGGCAGIVRHPAVRDLTKWMCQERGCAFTALAIWNAIENDDILAAACARLLLWTDPKLLPRLGDVQGAWDYYERVWRPGKPHRETWDAFYAAAKAEVVGI